MSLQLEYADVQKLSEDYVARTEDLSYEKDPRFIEYIALLCEHSKNRDNLIDSKQVFAGIRRSHGW